MLRVLPTLLALSCTASASETAHPELGIVAWERGYAQAQQRARDTGLPLLVLFDEVPGCSTVQGFGARVLSHPVVADAAEQLFVPVVVYNNVGGDDRAVLDSFREPTWNNPVVRILDGNGRPLAPRLAGDTSVAGLLGAMDTALRAAGREIPPWLQLVVEEQAAWSGTTQTATFATHCFWVGEGQLGALDGVVATRTGFAGGHEVVEVRYDPERTTAIALDRDAPGVKATTATGFRAAPKDDLYSLRHTAWAHVPLTPLQATRVNAALRAGVDPEPLVGPRQRARFRAQSGSGGTPQVHEDLAAGWTGR